MTSTDELAETVDGYDRNGCIDFLVGFMAAVVLAGAAWWIFGPSYLALDIPVTPNETGYFWWEEQRSRHTYADEMGSLYIYRRVGTGYDETQGWPTQQDAMAHFDSWLTERDWVERALFTSGDPAVPETGYLSDPSTYRVYTRPGDEWADGPRVVVMVVPVPEVEGAYDVVLTTAVPSILRKLTSGWD